MKSLFLISGYSLIFDPMDYFTYSMIKVGNHVFIGSGAKFSGNIKIGNKVMFGPNVTIMGGDHDITQPGRYMIDIQNHEKQTAKPKDVIIHDDVWIGANVTILKGVEIHRGSVVGAGSVVVKDVPPYHIVAGVPANVIKRRFDDNQIREHERLLYQQL